MKRIMIAPSRYQQGQDMLHELGHAIKTYGSKALMVASNDDLDRMGHALSIAQEKEAFVSVNGSFGGECTHAEITRLRTMVASETCDVIIGLGGGKALDTAKAISHFEQLPVIIIPTIASTDAPCSSLAVIYTENGAFDEYMFFTKNPDLVLVDSSVIAQAPVRFLISGMGDALSTYFEARACEKSFANNIPGGKSTKAARAIAKLCYETLLEDSIKAKAACERQVVTQALENIIEANILLSGIGFESSGLAAAHAVHNGLTALEETHHYYHGEKVAFGVLVQLVLENADVEELNRVISYNQSVGLPTCLSDLGIKDVTPEKVMAIATLACAEGETIFNMPFEVTREDVFAAIVTADQLGGLS